MWSAQLQALSVNYRCIAPDLRGFGQSSNDIDENSMGLMADDVFALLDYLGLDTATICGFSMGGYISFEMWRKQPQRFSKWLLINTKASRDLPDVLANRYKLIDDVSQHGSQAAATALLPRLVHTPFIDAPVGDEVYDMIVASLPGLIIQGVRALIVRMDFGALLPSISVPTSIIAGEYDVTTPASESEWMHERIAGSELHIVPGVGHMSPMEAPKVINRLIATFMAR